MSPRSYQPPRAPKPKPDPNRPRLPVGRPPKSNNKRTIYIERMEKDRLIKTKNRHKTHLKALGEEYLKHIAGAVTTGDVISPVDGSVLIPRGTTLTPELLAPIHIDLWVFIPLDPVLERTLTEAIAPLIKVRRKQVAKAKLLDGRRDEDSDLPSVLT